MIEHLDCLIDVLDGRWTGTDGEPAKRLARARTAVQRVHAALVRRLCSAAGS